MSVEFQLMTAVRSEPTLRYDEDSETYIETESAATVSEGAFVPIEPETVREFYPRSRNNPELTGTHIVFQNRGTPGYNVTASYDEVKTILSNAGLVLFEFDASLRVRDLLSSGTAEPTYKVSVNPKAVLGFHPRNPYADGVPRPGTRIVFKTEDYARPVTNAFEDVAVQMGPYVTPPPAIADGGDGGYNYDGDESEDDTVH